MLCLYCKGTLDKFLASTPKMYGSVFIRRFRLFFHNVIHNCNSSYCSYLVVMVHGTFCYMNCILLHSMVIVFFVKLIDAAVSYNLVLLVLLTIVQLLLVLMLSLVILILLLMLFLSFVKYSCCWGCWKLWCCCAMLCCC